MVLETLLVILPRKRHLSCVTAENNWKPFFRDSGRETAKMAQQVKAVTTRSDDLGSVSRTYMVKGKT